MLHCEHNRKGNVEDLDDYMTVPPFEGHARGSALVDGFDTRSQCILPGFLVRRSKVLVG